MSNAKQPENNNNTSNVTKISNEINQLCLEDMSQNFLNEIIKEMHDLYIEEIMKGRSFNTCVNVLESVLIKRKQNPDTIIKYCLDNESDPMVQFILATCYDAGKWVEKNEYKAFIYYQKSAEMGDAYGTSRVGYCYRHGIGVKKDEHKAFIYYQKSAEMGNAVGTCTFGYCYEKRIGVERDEHKAFIYYQKSAEMKFAKGAYNVGICYRFGIGIEKDERKAFEYYLKSAEYGFCCGMYHVGECYQDGIGVEKNKNLAFEWYLKSAITEHRCINDNNYFRWIEYDNFRNIVEVGKGGFSVVYKTSYKRQYGTNEDIAIKIIKDSHKDKQHFLNELKVYHEFGKYKGISMDKNTGDLILVLSYAKFGSLRDNLNEIFKSEWKIKLKILCDIINDLSNFHSKNLIHRNLHPGNILLKERYEPYIDLSSSISVDEKQDSHIYGVLPYLAPEILKGECCTQTVDIYSFGIIMIEILTGRRPFDGYNFDSELAAMICHGLRPEFILKTPKCYVQLAKQCINSDIKKRPTAFEITNILEKWKRIIASNSIVKSDMNKESTAVGIFNKLKKWKKIIAVSDSNVKLDKQCIDPDEEIKRQFLEADKSIKELPITSQAYDNMMYTSKLIDRREIVSEVENFRIN